MGSFSLTRRDKTPLPLKTPFQEIAEAILGKKYELSLVSVGTDEAKRLNTDYRDKTYVPDVLAFPLGKHEGEIVMCPITIITAAGEQGKSYRAHTAHLFIHACLHLKGVDHGTKMEKLENKFLKDFGFEKVW